MKELDSLEDAWRWYQDTRRLLTLLRRLSKHWDGLPWGGALGKESTFLDLNGDELLAQGDFSLSHLNDLAIVVLFSVFESQVRQHVLEEVTLEEPSIRHRAIRFAVTQAKERIELGSFFRVLEPFKDLHHDLVAQIDQVRDYRNWVAHGRRGEPKNNVDPETAYNRLHKFLQILDESPDNSPAS